jgi:hypothetical protein
MLELTKKVVKREQGIGQDLADLVSVYTALSQAETHAGLTQVLHSTPKPEARNPKPDTRHVS